MELCRGTRANTHTEVCYEYYDDCPVCEKQEIIDELLEKIDDLEKQLAELKG